MNRISQERPHIYTTKRISSPKKKKKTAFRNYFYQTAKILRKKIKISTRVRKIRNPKRKNIKIINFILIERSETVISPVTKSNSTIQEEFSTEREALRLRDLERERENIRKWTRQSERE